MIEFSEIATLFLACHMFLLYLKRDSCKLGCLAERAVSSEGMVRVSCNEWLKKLNIQGCR